VAHVAFKIHNFWPHNPDTWFRQLESKFRICNISSSLTKFDLLLMALLTEVCTNITNSVRDIDEAAANAYQQLKALLVSRYTKACWTRAFELLKYPEIGDMKPTELMRQMKALLPTDDRPGITFMAMFLLRLPSDMRDNLIAKDFKYCTMMAEYPDLLYSSRAGSTIAAVNTEYEAAINAVSGGRRQEFSPHDRRSERRSPSRQGRSCRKTPGPYKEDSDICYFHATYGDKARKCKPGCLWTAGNGQAARTERSWRRHEFLLGR
jgi:hypothetical protein